MSEINEKLEPLDKEKLHNLLLSNWSAMNDSSFISTLTDKIYKTFGVPSRKIVYPEKQDSRERESEVDEPWSRDQGFNEAIDE